MVGFASFAQEVAGGTYFFIVNLAERKRTLRLIMWAFCKAIHDKPAKHRKSGEHLQ